MRALLTLLAGLVLVLSAASGWAATQERRVALVVGNSAYRRFPQLPNPRNDAEDMTATLKRLGFDVHGGVDLTRQDLRDQLRAFARAAQGADAALIFYAGHGLQYRGRNYLVPVDAKLEDEFDLDYETVRVDDVVEELNRADGAKILILDACRNLPLAGKSSKDAFSSSGLAKLSGRGLVVAYATQANAVAYDGTGRNSIFTGAFIKTVQEPGLDLPQLFQRVSISVDKQTGGRQTPEVSLSYPGQFFFNRGETDREAWPKVRSSGDPDALRDFIARFPNSFLVDDAKDLIQRIEEDRRRNPAQVASRDTRQPDTTRRTVIDEQAAARTKEDADRLAWQALQDEQRRRADARQRAEQDRTATEGQDRQRQAEADAKRQADERRQAETARVAEEARQRQAAQDRAAAEAQERQRLAAEARERQRLADLDAKRQVEERRAAEQARVAEEARQRKLAEEQAKADAAERRRLADEEQKRQVEARRLEQVRLAEEARQRKIADDQAKAEALQRQRLAEADAKRQAEEKRAADQARVVEEARLRKLAEDQAKADAAERKRLVDEEASRQAEIRRQAEESRLAEQARQRQAAQERAAADAEARQRLAEDARRQKAAEAEAAQDRDRSAWAELEEQQKRRAQLQAERVTAPAPGPSGSETVAVMNGAEPSSMTPDPAPTASIALSADSAGPAASPSKVTRLASNDAGRPAGVAQPPDSAFPREALDEEATIRETQAELGRIGCYAEMPSGRWTRDSRTAMERFGRQAKLTPVPEQPSPDILNDLKTRPAHFCPLECGRGEVSEGDRCVAAAKPKDEPKPVVERKAPKPRPVVQERERAEPRPVVQAKPRPQAAPPQAPVATAASKPAARPVMGVGF